MTLPNIYVGTFFVKIGNVRGRSKTGNSGWEWGKRINFEQSWGKTSKKKICAILLTFSKNWGASALPVPVCATELTAKRR